MNQEIRDLIGQICVDLGEYLEMIEDSENRIRFVCIHLASKLNEERKMNEFLKKRLESYATTN